MGGDAGAFPATRLSVVRAAQSGDPDIRRQGFDALIAAYWKPVYKYLRIKWRASDEDARDLTQEFFARTVEKGSSIATIPRAPASAPTCARASTGSRRTRARPIAG